MKNWIKNTDFIAWIKLKLRNPIADNRKVNSLLSPSLSVAFIIIAGLMALYLQSRGAAKPKAPSGSNIDQHIPTGHTLIPIEIVNYESLDSIIGTFSVVDLYSVPLDHKKTPKKMASRVKLYRSPKNPSHFAILVSEKKAGKVLKSGGPYSVTIRNPNFNAGTVFEKVTLRPRKRIQFLTE